MSFSKYPSLDSVDKQKTFELYSRQYLELQSEDVVIQEKIDGANIQIFFDIDGSVSIGKRSGFIQDEDFHGVWNVFHSIKDKINDIRIALISNVYGDGNVNSQIRFFGELFGEGIHNRISYGNERRYVIFDATLDGKYVSYDSLKDVGGDMVVENYGRIKFRDILDYNPEYHVSHYSPNGSYAEGVVFKPVYSYTDKGSGKIIAMKAKTKTFSEKGGENKPHKAKKQNKQDNISEEAKYLRSEYNDYLTKNRLISIFSKEGPIQGRNQFGFYIKLVQEDAKEQFMQDFGESFRKLDDKEAKVIFKDTGRIVTSMLEEFV